jgi:thiamine biosynthesis lipoprotein ApbE
VQIAGSARELRLRDGALATSSDTKSVVSVGRGLGTIGHIMNPTSGFPLDTEQQVTVVAPTAIAADALSTGTLVRGMAPNGVRAIFTPE